MTVREFIAKLEQHMIDDHGNEADIVFWDIKNDCELEINEQNSRDPGIEIENYPGCHCDWYMTINLRKK